MAKPNAMKLDHRKDVRIGDDAGLAKAITASAKTLSNHESQREQFRKNPKADIRKALIEADTSDPNGYERIIGASDLVSVNFLARGIKASQAVCRIGVPGQDSGWYGTGFIVGPGLLVTNNHVLASREDAAQAEAEFGYEHDVEGVLMPPVRFNFAPHDVFFTDIEHDITFVSVVPYSDGGVPLERYGFLPMLPLTGKGLHGEWVTLAQHPGGQPKQLAVRANQIVELDPKQFSMEYLERFIHYTTDTEPGSSGAPVLNDQWQVVAVHHKAIAEPGTLAAGDQPDNNTKWLANEGVRVSAISNLLETRRFADRDAANALDRLERAIGLPQQTLAEQSPGPLLDPASERDPAPYKSEQWKTWAKSHALGYDPQFLSVKLPLSTIIAPVKAHAAIVKGGGVEVDYLHFSTIIHKHRRFPMIAAVNVRGDKLIHPGTREGRFRVDTRLDRELQPADNFYEKKLGKDRIQFSRGHLVRRFDPCWGDTKAESQLADNHTFHYTNAAPQAQRFNGGEWLDIEDYVLNRIQIKEKRMTIFTGPIFRKSDPEYGESREGGPWRIPISYWKIAVIQKDAKRIAATAFIRGQTKFIKALFEARVFTNVRQRTLTELQSDHIQTTIKTVEDETGLNFLNTIPCEHSNPRDTRGSCFHPMTLLSSLLYRQRTIAKLMLTVT